MTLATTVILGSLVHSAPEPALGSTAYAPVLRKNVANLTATEIQGFRDAVAAMKALPATDKRSWQAQAEIHQNFCPHGNNHFLPWHRKYLWYFEKILVSMSGGKLKALPYWDYTNPAQAKLPAIFVNPTYGGGTANPLYHANRSATYASGVTPLPAGLMDPVNAMNSLTFNAFSSSLEQTPHNNLHVQISGTMATYMSPLDPIFWLHHCNIDRLWEKWLSMGGGRANPTDAAWLNANWNSTTFYDASGTGHTLKNSDVLNIVSQLNYTYRLIFVLPKWWYEWRRLFRWEILRPIPFDFVLGPLKTRPFDIPAEHARKLSPLARLDPKTINAVLEFEVQKGVASAATFDLIAMGPKGSKGVKVATFSLFGLRHGGGPEHMHGMAENETPKVRLTLSPAETARLLPLLKSKQISFAVQVTKGSANNLKFMQDAAVSMNLTAIDFMQTVQVRKR